MRVNLDKNYTMILNQWGNPELIWHTKHPKLDKGGNPKGKPYYFQTFGQAVKFYIKQSASRTNMKSLEDLAAYIDGKLKGVELKIDQMFKENGQDEN